MKKVLCIIYPNFSLYEIASLTSTLALSFDITIDYVASDYSIVVSEDGLPCQPTKTLDQVRIEDYSCVILPGMAMATSSTMNRRFAKINEGHQSFFFDCLWLLTGAVAVLFIVFPLSGCFEKLHDFRFDGAQAYIVVNGIHAVRAVVGKLECFDDVLRFHEHNAVGQNERFVNVVRDEHGSFAA